MNSPDLSNAFGPSGKSKAEERLGGLLPPRASTPTTTEPQAEADAPEADRAPQQTPTAKTEEPVAPAAPAAARKVAKADTTTQPAALTSDHAYSAGAARQINTWILPEVKQYLKGQRRQTGRTNAELAFDAIDATAKQLPDLIGTRRTRGREPGSLFPGRVQTRTVATNRELWSIQATPAEIKVIDRLVDQTGAESRSELLSVALEQHFGLAAVR
jgi:hypothetical protein